MSSARTWAAVVAGGACCLLLAGCGFDPVRDIIYAPDRGAMAELQTEIETWNLDTAGELLGTCSYASGYGAQMYDYTLFFRGSDARPAAVDLLIAQGLSEWGVHNDSREEFSRTDSRFWYGAVITSSSAHEDQRHRDCEPVDLNVGDTIVIVSTSIGESQ